jgi:hypothetical protein
MLEDALLVLWLESKKKGKQQLQDQFNNLQPEIQVSYSTTKHYTLFTSVSRINYRLFARELYLCFLRFMLDDTKACVLNKFNSGLYFQKQGLYFLHLLRKTAKRYETIPRFAKCSPVGQEEKKQNFVPL